MGIVYGIHDDIGLRQAMEDEHGIYEDDARRFFGAEVYDGHGGRRPAQIAAEMLTPTFLHLWAQELKEPAGKRKGEAGLLRDAYLAVDAQIVERRLQGGTCAVHFYIIGDRFLAANTGDSRAVIGVAGGARTLTRDHKPDKEGERSRIEALGGRILVLGVPRVEGVLAISRALGDPCLKPYVIAEPRITVGTLGRENDFAVLACDGVWDVLSSEDVMEMARRAGNPQKGADLVGQAARDRGSRDNITVIVLDLRQYTSPLDAGAMNITDVYDWGQIPCPQ